MRESRHSRRRGHAEEAAGHERWLVSYADFVTLLFALFVVLFATSYRDNMSIRRLSRAIHVGFQKLGAFSAEASHGPEAYPVLGPETPVDANPANTPTNCIVNFGWATEVPTTSSMLEIPATGRLGSTSAIFARTPATRD